MLSLSDLRRPLLPGWKLDVGADTGTYMSAVFVLFPPDTFDAFVVAEFPNYRYVAGEIELLGLSIPEWSREVVSEYRRFVPGSSSLSAWVDPNSQFKTELRRYHINCRGNSRKLELRVEITREYVQNHRLWLAPWLHVLPYEMEHAKWPEETGSTGRLERLKEDDHTLDGVEHVCSRRPRHASMIGKTKPRFIDRFLAQHRTMTATTSDPHLGRHV